MEHPRQDMFDRVPLVREFRYKQGAFENAKMAG